MHSQTTSMGIDAMPRRALDVPILFPEGPRATTIYDNLHFVQHQRGRMIREATTAGAVIARALAARPPIAANPR